MKNLKKCRRKYVSFFYVVKELLYVITLILSSLSSLKNLHEPQSWTLVFELFSLEEIGALFERFLRNFLS